MTFGASERRAFLNHLWGVSAAWLLALAVCLTGWALLSGSNDKHRLAEQVARAGGIASAELASDLARPTTPELSSRVRALLVREDAGYAWLRVRDVDGHAIAAAGRLEPAGGDRQSSAFMRKLRRYLYTLISTEHRQPLMLKDRRVGTLEFGLLIGGGSGHAGARLAVGLLALLLGLPALLLLSLRLRTTFARDWSRGSVTAARATAAVLEPVVASAQLQAPPSLARSAGELMAAFDHGIVVLDGLQIVHSMNALAEQLTGWSQQEARGRAASDVLGFYRADLRYQVSLPLTDILNGVVERLEDRFFLRARNGPLREVDLNIAPIRDSVRGVNGILLSLREVKKASGALQRILPATVLAPAQDPRELSQMLLDQVLECVITVDSQDRIQFANGRALENFGYALAELRGEHVSRLLPVPFLRLSQTRIADYALSLPDISMPEVVARRRDGSQFPASLIVHPVSFQQRQGFVVTVRPVAVQLPEGALSPRLRHLLENTADEMIVIEPQDLRLRAGNLRALRNLGVSQERLTGMTLPQLCPRLDADTFEKLLTRLRQGHDEWVEYRTVHRRADGSTYEVQVRLSLNQAETPPCLLAVAQDVSAEAVPDEVTLRESRLDFFDHHDGLTGLPSRSLFMDRLQQAVLAADRERGFFAVAHLNLSAFSDVNQEYGYETGDLLLKAVADRLSGVVRGADTVARLGGDEFTLLLGGLRGSQDAMPALKRLLTVFDAPFRIGRNAIPVKAALGATVYPQDAVSADLLLRHAGHALREAQAKGGRQICLYQAGVSATSLAAARASHAEQLQEAQAQGQLGIELQAVMDVRARLTVGAEVLLAWRLPGHGLLRTCDQLRQAGVDPSLLASLAGWIIERACEQHAGWRDLELPSLPLLINLSAVPLSGRDAAQALRDLLARYRMPADRLIVMVNADTLESLLSSADSWLPVLRDLGLRFGVNDVDPANLELLRRADVDVVQLTPSATAGLPASREAADRSAAIVQAGRRIGAQIFASGVERAEQREALLALGCDLQQGRLLGEVMAPRDFARMLVRTEVGAI